MSYVVHLATSELISKKPVKKLKQHSKKKQIKQALKKACHIMVYNHRKKAFLVALFFVFRPTPVWAAESISYYVALIQEADLLLEMMEFRRYLKLVEVQEIMRQVYGSEFSMWDDFWPFLTNTVWPFLKSPSAPTKVSFITMVILLLSTSIATKTSPIIILKIICHQLVSTDAKD